MARKGSGFLFSDCIEWQDHRLKLHCIEESKESLPKATVMPDFTFRRFAKGHCRTKQPSIDASGMICVLGRHYGSHKPHV
jgi:hypothetical protein